MKQLRLCFLFIALLGLFSHPTLGQPGTLDPGFGIDGKVTTPFDGDAGALAMAILEDGRIVLVGTDGTTGSMARYLPDGTLDPTFDGDGKLTFAAAGMDRTVFQAISVRSDGHMVVAGYVKNGSYYDQIFVRLLPDGTLDTSFSSDGVFVMNYESNTVEWCVGVALLPDNRIVLVSRLNDEWGNDLVLVGRLYPSGNPDLTFALWGFITSPSYDFFTDVHYYPKAFMLHPNGDIIVTGSKVSATERRFFLQRFSSSGALQQDFGTSGLGVYDVDGAGGSNDTDVSSPYALALQADGSIIAGGTCHMFDNEFTLIRATASGDLDPTFGSGGVVRTNLEVGTDAEIHGLVVSNDGKILAAGTAATGTSTGHFVMVRYQPDGSLDPSFGTGGTATVEFNPNDQCYAAALHTDANYLVAGRTDLGADRFALARVVSGLSTGLSEETERNFASVFPNPATDKLYIKNAYEAARTITVTDMLGHPVLSTSIANGVVRVDGLAAGAYSGLLLSSNGESIARVRFIKQ
jgi:uncharacterized delta-60 repeat protein